MIQEEFLDMCLERLQALTPLLEKRGYRLNLIPKEEKMRQGSLQKEGEKEPCCYFCFGFLTNPKFLVRHQLPTEGNDSYLKDKNFKVLSALTPFGMTLYYVDKALILNGVVSLPFYSARSEEWTFPEEEILSALVDAQDFLRTLVPYFKKENPERKIPPYLEQYQSGRRKFLP